MVVVGMIYNSSSQAYRQVPPSWDVPEEPAPSWDEEVPKADAGSLAKPRASWKKQRLSRKFLDCI